MTPRRLPRSFLTLTGTLLLSGANMVAVADTLYKCVEPSGSVLYTNQKADAKKCVVLSRELPVTTVAPPPRSAARSGSVATGAAATPSPASFPRVDGDTQRGRDNDRRRILEQELANEQQNLDKARKAVADDEAASATRPGNAAKSKSLRDEIVLHERNVEALRRELANVK